jgi:hypothetical protein
MSDILLYIGLGAVVVGGFALMNTALISFEKDFTNCESEVLYLLQYKYHWYVGSKAGCSCTFRL